MSFRTMTLLAVVSLFSPACSDSADRAQIAPDPTFSMHPCESGVSASDGHALISERRAEVDALEAAGSLSSGQANALRDHSTPRCGI